MASQNDIRAGRAFVEVFTDDSKLQQGLLAINKRMEAWSQQLSGMGMRAMVAAGALSLPFVTGAKVFSSFGDQIEKMTYRTGMGSEALSEISYAAQICGTDIKAVEISIKGMQKTLSGAADELGSAEKKLAKLGLTLGDLDGKKPEEQFFILLERLRDIKDENIRAATALAIFGKSGTQLLPMVAAGSKGIAELREEARKLGISLSAEDAKSAAALTDDLTRLKTALTGVSLAIGSAVAPAIQTVTQFFTNNIAIVSEWLREHKSLVVTAGLAVVALGGVGTALLTLGGLVKVASLGTYGLATAFGLLRASILAPIGMMTALASGAVMFSTQIVKSTVSLFGMIRGLGTFSRMATTAGFAAGVLANQLSVGLFNTAVALPGIFARMQDVINKTLTDMIAISPARKPRNKACVTKMVPFHVF